ncbi:hypothetical protein G7009_22700 [Pseudomonas capeferrum]|uniref:hypothetical protein n=1 Tax=Pseudomonas capeferrum TaxID=1495066 RepID=UPI0015E33EE1|nr:hypothetical protein [Pseudomonas capeferrum]MBA1204529.1 hypothetical protein [Pseudomonas capeferrum]
MNIRHLELSRSLDLQLTLRKLHNDEALDFAEYRVLQDCAEAKFDQLVRKFEGQCDLEQLRLANIRMSHLLQSSCLALRRLALDRNDRSLARQALEYQIACMQASLRRSLIDFGDV